MQLLKRKLIIRMQISPDETSPILNLNNIVKNLLYFLQLEKENSNSSAIIFIRMNLINY